jgi:hypothetical protein
MAWKAVDFNYDLKAIVSTANEKTVFKAKTILP